MNAVAIEVVQGSGEWLAERVGNVTASRARDVTARLKSGEFAQARTDYALELVVERLTGSAVQHFVTQAMQWGTDQEPFARAEYEFASGNSVVQVGFVRHAELEAGCSPDGLIGKDGLVEIKCPNSTKHVLTLLNGMPREHLPQIQFQLWVTGRQWCDFVSYDPRLPTAQQLYIQRVQRDEIYISELAEQVSSLLGEVEAMVRRIKEGK